MGDWLGTGIIAPQLRMFRLFHEACKFVHMLKLQSRNEWGKYCKGALKGKIKKPDDIPMSPSLRYKGKGWINWGDWLGTGNIANQLKEYRSFHEARKFVHTLQLQSRNEWQKYCYGEIHRKGIKPDDIPFKPQRTYKNKGWSGWGDWLGTGYVANFLRKYRSFFKARAFVHRLHLKGASEWKKYCKGELKGKGKKPIDIPYSASKIYKDKGWISWPDWLGKQRK